jgi:hypothetical protein
VPTPYSPYKPATGTGLLAQGAPETENRRYVNKETGQVRMIPFNKATGQSLYPIPEGFVFEPEAPKEEAKTTKVQTAKVKPVDTGSGDDGGPSLTEQGYREDANVTFMGGKNVNGRRVGSRDIGVIIDIPGGITKMGGIAGGLLAGITGNYPEGTMMGISLKGDPETIRYVTPERYKTLIKNPEEGDKFLDDLIKSKSIEDDVRSIAKDERIDEKLTKDKDFMSRFSKAADTRMTEDTFKSTEPDRSDIVTASQTQQVDSGSDDPSGGFSDEGFSGSGYGASEGSFGGIGDFNKGGLAKKKKPKVKKMKRGGLASKK